MSFIVLFIYLYVWFINVVLLCMVAVRCGVLLRGCVVSCFVVFVFVLCGALVSFV